MGIGRERVLKQIPALRMIIEAASLITRSVRHRHPSIGLGGGCGVITVPPNAEGGEVGARWLELLNAPVIFACTRGTVMVR